MIHLPHILSAVLLVSGIALVLCSRYLLERARRCEISTRAGVAALLGAEGAISIMLAVSSQPIAWWTVVCSALTAAMAWLVIRTERTEPAMAAAGTSPHLRTSTAGRCRRRSAHGHPDRRNSA